VAHLHPAIVSELTASLEAQMPSFPANVVDAYAKLKQHTGDISTPTGASPRPDHVPVSATSYEPPGKRQQ
jgi:hypothetical protein